MWPYLFKPFNLNHCCRLSSRSAQLHQLWIDAFHDLQANLQTFSSSLALADLNADDNYKLILADLGSGSTHVKLKVNSQLLYVFFYDKYKTLPF